MATFTGVSAVLPALSIFQTATSEPGSIGTKVETADGRVYRLAKVGASALVVDNLVQAPLNVANHANCTAAASAIASGTTPQTLTFTLGATAATANQYAGGYAIVNAGTGIGQVLTISKHPAAASGASLTVTVEEKLQVALDTTSRVTLVANPYNGVIQATTSGDGTPVGSAIIAAAAGSYCWVQTRGPASVLSDASVAAAGLGIMPSTTTAGCVTVATATGRNIGEAIIAGVSAEARPVFLTID